MQTELSTIIACVNGARDGIFQADCTDSNRIHRIAGLRHFLRSLMNELFEPAELTELDESLVSDIEALHARHFAI